MYPHRIRLRGPWQCEPLARLVLRDGALVETFTDLPPACRMTMPCRWSAGGLGEFSGRVRFRRRFGYPGQIDAHERVWLAFAAIAGQAVVTLNGQHLSPEGAASGPFEFDVTALLRPRNELVVEVVSSTGDGGLWGDVALEVRCTAYLRGIRVWIEAEQVHVRGDLVGVCDRALDLYVLLDRSTIAYLSQEAVPEGKPFHIVSGELNAPPSGPAHTVRVELVHGATVWFAHEEEVAAASEGPQRSEGLTDSET